MSIQIELSENQIKSLQLYGVTFIKITPDVSKEGAITNVKVVTIPIENVIIRGETK